MTPWSIHRKSALILSTNSLDAINTVVQQLNERFGDAVARLHYECDVDSADEPAVWLWGIFPDEQLEAQWPFENRMAMRQSIRDEFQAAGISSLDLYSFSGRQ